MIYLKAFMAGILLPSLVLPIGVSVNRELLNVLFIHFIPLLWGIWNVLSVLFFRMTDLKKGSIFEFIIGAILGLIIALFGVFCSDLPSIVGLTGAARYLPLGIAPIAYGILWVFVVEPLNRVVGVTK